MALRRKQINIFLFTTAYDITWTSNVIGRFIYRLHFSVFFFAMRILYGRYS